MWHGWSRSVALVLAAATLTGVAACGSDHDVAVQRSADAAVAPPATTPATTSTTIATTTSSTTAAPLPAPPPPTTTTTKPPVERVVTETGHSPFATVGPVVLHHPASPTERIGFHQSGHDGAQPLTATATATRPFVMESRERDTAPAGAADIVVQPGAELRAPVTGTVIRGGRYTLYCDHSDEFVVIEPDARPGWEVKLLHFEGLMVGRGQRVEAGVTPVGTTARTLPFESQVDEFTAEPSWPHVHVEVVDPRVPDRPTPGGGCS